MGRTYIRELWIWLTIDADWWVSYDWELWEDVLKWDIIWYDWMSQKFILATEDNTGDPMMGLTMIWVATKDWATWNSITIQKVWIFDYLKYLWWQKYPWQTLFLLWPTRAYDVVDLGNSWNDYLWWNNNVWQVFTLAEDKWFNTIKIPQLWDRTGITLKIYTAPDKTTEITTSFTYEKDSQNNGWFVSASTINLTAGTYYFELEDTSIEIYIYNWTIDWSFNWNAYLWWVEQVDKAIWFEIWTSSIKKWAVWNQPTDYTKSVSLWTIINQTEFYISDFDKANTNDVYKRSETMSKYEIQNFPDKKRFTFVSWYSTYNIIKTNESNEISAKITGVDTPEAWYRIITEINEAENYIIAPLLSSWISIDRYMSITAEVWDNLYVDDNWDISIRPWSNEIVIWRVTWAWSSYVQTFETVDPLAGWISWVFWESDLSWDDFSLPDTLENITISYKSTDWKRKLAEASDIEKMNNLKVSLLNLKTWDIWPFTNKWTLNVEWVVSWIDYYLQNPLVNKIEQKLINSWYVVWWEKPYLWQSMLIPFWKITNIAFRLYKYWTSNYVLWLRVFRDKTRNTVLFTSPTTYVANDLVWEELRTFDLTWLDPNPWEELYFEIYTVSWDTAWSNWAWIRMQGSNPYPDWGLYYTTEATWTVSVSTYWDAVFELNFIETGKIWPLPTNYTLEWGSYENKSFSVAWQWTDPNSIDIPWEDGLDMYVLDMNSDAIFQYVLSDPEDIESAVYANKTFDLNASLPWEGDIRGIKLNKEKTKLYVVWRTTTSIYQFTLTTPWDISTATYDNLSFSIGAQENLPDSMCFNDDETYFYVIWYWTDTIYQYNFDNTDISQSSYANKSFVVPDWHSYWVRLSKDWLKAFVVWDDNNRFYEFDLGTKDDIWTAVDNWIFLSFSAQTWGPWWMTFDKSWRRIYLVNRTNDNILQYRAWVWEQPDNLVLIATWIEENILDISDLENSFWGLSIVNWSETIAIPNWSSYNKITTFNTELENKNIKSELVENQITITQKWIYEISCSFSTNVATSWINLETEVFKNNVATWIWWIRDIFVLSEPSNLSFVWLLKIESWDIIDIRTRHNWENPVDTTGIRASFTIKKISR